ALTAVDLRLLREDAPMSAEELEKVVRHLSGVLGLARIQTGQPPRSLRATLAAEVANSDRVHAARTRLMEASSVQDLVQRVFLVSRFPPLQVILLEEKHAFEVRRDEELKLLALAPWQIDAIADSEERTRYPDAVFADFLPHVLSARRTQGRLEQRIALLRHVEALRLYAAENGGTLPEKLTEVPVPLPPDPFTGKPFVYRVEADTAHLCGSPPRGEEQNPCYNVHYEVTIQTRMR